MDRPVTTLFMLMSVDGKISTGAADELDVDKDFPQIAGVREGLHQYYEIEQTTDLWTLNSARVLCCNRQPAFKRKRHPVFLCFVKNICVDYVQCTASGVSHRGG